jgi:hypothetical protein
VRERGGAVLSLKILSNARSVQMNKITLLEQRILENRNDSFLTVPFYFSVLFKDALITVLK